jgi:tetratricopeptide (TPR) repeat protein
VAVGLAQINGARGEYIAFASSPGKPAIDGSAGGHNGLFTSHLLADLKTPGLTIDQVFNNVRQEVDRESRGAQTPWSNSGLVGDFCFDPRGCAVRTTSPVSVVPTAPDCSEPASAPAGEGEFVSQARCASQAADWAAAVQLYNGAIRINSDNPEYYLQRARAQIQLRQLDRALADLAKAAELYPDNADYSFEAGKAQELFGNNVKAVEALSKAHSLDPKRPDICAEFAAGLEKTGQTRTAAEVRRSCGL